MWEPFLLFFSIGKIYTEPRRNGRVFVIKNVLCFVAQDAFL